MLLQFSEADFFLNSFNFFVCGRSFLSDSCAASIFAFLEESDCVERNNIFCCKFTVFRHFNVGCVCPLFRCLCFFKLNKTEELTFFLDSKDDSCRYLFY